jgi:hypothetical protein
LEEERRRRKKKKELGTRFITKKGEIVFQGKFCFS